MDWQTFFLNAEGRIGRRDFWIAFALIFAAGVVARMIPLLGGLIGLALLWPHICISAKRLHDMGRSAWLLLAPFAVVTLCAMVGALFAGVGALGAAVLGAVDADNAAAGSMLAGMGVFSLFMAIGALINFAFLLWVGLSAGEPGENRFGPEPDRAAPFGVGATRPGSAPSADTPTDRPPEPPPIVE